MSVNLLKFIVIMFQYQLALFAFTSSSSDCSCKDRRYSIRAHFGHFWFFRSQQARWNTVVQFLQWIAPSSNGKSTSTLLHISHTYPLPEHSSHFLICCSNMPNNLLRNSTIVPFSTAIKSAILYILTHWIKWRFAPTEFSKSLAADAMRHSVK